MREELGLRMVLRHVALAFVGVQCGRAALGKGLGQPQDKTSDRNSTANPS